MVFSFFKKQPEKMPERPAAKPRPTPAAAKVGKDEPLPPASAAPSAAAAPVAERPVQPHDAAKVAPVATAQPAPAPAPEDDFDLDFDEDFTDALAIDVSHGSDPLQADVEQVVMLFANGQDNVARSLLESFTQAYPGESGRRFWWLLFDLLQVLNDRPGYDRLCTEFVCCYETSPPAWRKREDEAVKAARPADGAPRFALQGVLTAENSALLEKLETTLRASKALLIDFGKLVGCDDVVAAALASSLEKARRAGCQITLANVDPFLKRLNERLPMGDITHEAAWLLLLELLQQYGDQARFEERAVDYAVTFERSPPSWENLPAARQATVVETEDEEEAGPLLTGDLKNARFDELLPMLEENPHPVIDLSAVRRMDFFSAGQLANRLAPFKAAGKEIVIRSPNHLIAELLSAVGLGKQARIIVPKS